MALQCVENVDFVFLSSLEAVSLCCLHVSVVGCLIWVGTVQLEVITVFAKVSQYLSSLFTGSTQAAGAPEKSPASPRPPPLPLCRPSSL